MEIADHQLDNRAEIDARDVDHESTPAQYMVAKRPDVARYLIHRGCTTDILAAAAFGDAVLPAQRDWLTGELNTHEVALHAFPV